MLGLLGVWQMSDVPELVGVGEPSAESPHARLKLKRLLEAAVFVCSLKRSPAPLASDRRLTVSTNCGKIQQDLTYDPKQHLFSPTEISLYVNAEDNDPQQVCTWKAELLMCRI